MALNSKPIILYAEDDQDDFDALHDALQQITQNYSLQHAKHGEEAVKYLNDGNTKPCLLVLDLNMPVMDGKEVLKWVKNEAAFKHIPVMIFTTSSREDDIKLCQSYNCTFFRKPTLYRDLLHIAQVMLQMCEESKR
jgi:CheY-like chemotaxis protein